MTTPTKSTRTTATAHAASMMDSDTKHRLLAAAELAQRHYPGAVGELLHQELLSWMVCGRHLGSTLIMRVAGQIINTIDPAVPDPDNPQRRTDPRHRTHPTTDEGLGPPPGRHGQRRWGSDRVTEPPGGGPGSRWRPAFFRSSPPKRADRDVRGGPLHPLTPEATVELAGRAALA